MSLKAYFRALQVFIPGLQNARFKWDRWVRRSLRKVHDPDWLAFHLLAIGEGEILDVGANRGLSIDSFRLVLPDRSIVAFEPNTHLADMLTAEFKSTAKVRIEALALSDKAGSETLYIPRYRNWNFDGLASLDRSEALSWLNAERLKGFDPRLQTCVEMPITVTTVDQLGLKPAVIKLDTQGTEASVLTGGLQTIESYTPVILLESATKEIVGLLGRFGYRPYAFDGQALIADKIDAKNVFFLTAKHYQPKA